MPLAFFVEWIGAASFADLWRIELQCDLPRKTFCQFPDAPLAHLIGIQAKQGWDKGETSLDSPPTLRLTALNFASPLANQKRERARSPAVNCQMSCQIKDFKTFPTDSTAG